MKAKKELDEQLGNCSITTLPQLNVPLIGEIRVIKSPTKRLRN